jgi:hypothetical protein
VGEQLNVTYSECVFVVLGTQRAMRMRGIIICGPSGSKTFFRVTSNKAQISDFLYVCPEKKTAHSK